MKTRGKTKVETNPNDYSKDSNDPMDDGTDTNGYLDEKTDDGMQGRGETRIGRNATTKRPGRVPRVGATRNRTDKHLMESAEFQEVVKGFIEFIEDMKNRKKKPIPLEKKRKNESKLYKSLEEPAPHKKVRPDTEPVQAQSSEKFEPQSEVFPTDSSKTEQNGPYRQPLPQQPSNPTRFKEDMNMKDIGDLLGGQREKEQANKYPNNYLPMPGQDQKRQYWSKDNETSRSKDNQMNKLAFPGGMMDLNSYDKFLPNASIQDFNTNPLLMKQQQNKAPNQYGYDNNVFKDLMQRMQLQNFPDQNPLRSYYMQPYDNYGIGVNKNNDLINLQMLEALLQTKNQPNNLLGSLLGSTQGAAALFGDLSRELPYMVQNMGLANQRFGNQSLGIELMQNDPEVINPKTFEGKLGRAATHVAIAYFIYFKSLDPDTIAKADKSKMDPTYNARMLKEKKYESFPADNAMVSKLMPPGFENRLSSLGLANVPLDYLGGAHQDLQRLLAQQGLSSDQFREAQIQRLQQEALLRNEELNQTRAGYQGKSDVKQEEKEDKAEAQRRRANEYKETDRTRQSGKQTQPKEEEIIEIKENSDAEAEGDSEAKIEVKDEKSDQKEKKAVSDEQSLRLDVTKAKDKAEENAGAISAEDIVEEITELTNPPGFDQDKNKRGKNRRPVPVKKNPNEVVKSTTQGPATQKVYAVNDENESLVHTHNQKLAKSADEGKGIQVISSDEGEIHPEEEDAGINKKETKEGKSSIKPQ